jgi:short-subunit dehydrogenase
LKKDYPDLKFRSVPVDLTKPGYVEQIAKATEDITPNLIFNNAGFVCTGLFADSPLGRQLANFNCNAKAPVEISHYFLNQMLDNKQQGCICFTSSPAGTIPAPLTAMYSATKAFLTNFATTMGCEYKSAGIDCLTVHPSPVDTGFYSGNTHGVDAMTFFQKHSYSPKDIADCFFRSVGRQSVHEQGYFSLAMKLLLKLLEVNLLSTIMMYTSHFSADFKKVKMDRPIAKKD